MGGWQFWIDCGGTFTDIVACDPDGALVPLKLSSNHPAPPADNALAGIRRFLGLASEAAIPPEQVAAVKLGIHGQDADAAPALRLILDQMAADLGGARLMVMQSWGGLSDWRRFQDGDALLSGPAGGVIGGVAASLDAGFSAVIGCDIGATATRIWHYDGAFERRFVTLDGDAMVPAPSLDIHTLVTGGDWTVTDCNLALGKIDPNHFPKAHAALSEQMAAETLGRVVKNIAGTIRQFSTACDHNLAHHALTCYGGAGGQHACLLADQLAMETVIIPPLAGVLSAWGMGLADLGVMKERALDVALDVDSIAIVNRAMADIEATARCELERQGVERPDMRARRRLRVRTPESDHTLDVAFGDMDSITSACAGAHALRVISAYIEVMGPGTPITMARLEAAEHAVTPMERTRVFCAGTWHDSPVFARAQLRPGHRVDGPALVVEDHTCTVIEPGWHSETLPQGHLILRRTPSR